MGGHLGFKPHIGPKGISLLKTTSSSIAGPRGPRPGPGMKAFTWGLTFMAWQGTRQASKRETPPTTLHSYDTYEPQHHPMWHKPQAGSWLCVSYWTRFSLKIRIVFARLASLNWTPFMPSFNNFTAGSSLWKWAQFLVYPTSGWNFVSLE